MDLRAWRGGAGLIDEPLYRYRALAYQTEVHAAVNIGLVRAALDIVAAMASGAKIMPGALPLANRGYYRAALARGEARWRSVRAFFYEVAEQAWDVLLSGDLPLNNLLRLSAAHAAHDCADIVQQAYRCAGIAAIQKVHRLQHIVRDTMVVTQHASLSEAIFDDAGAIPAGAGGKAGYP